MIIRPLGIIAALVVPLSALAQTAPSLPSVTVVHISALNSSVVSAQKGDFTSAELALFSDNAQRPNTMDWDIEASVKLAHLAFTLRQSHDYPNSNIAVQRALARLTDTTARHVADTSAAVRSQAYETVGFIYETLLFDPTSAKAAYLQAQSLNSASKAASLGLARIQAAEQIKSRVLGGHD